MRHADAGARVVTSRPVALDDHGMDAEPCFFEAVIVPHRSLSARGLWLLVGVIIALSMVTTTVFWLLGAWPIAIFNGVEITLAVLLLRHNARAIRANEIILLSPSVLRIIRTAQNGRRTEQSVSPAWINVVLQDRRGRVPGLFLSAHGVHVEVGASLGEPQKLDLAEALRTALDNWRNPRFDNPQLG
jgi:uncharacterized membrane protein